VTAKNKKELPAIKVISKLLKYFKDEFFAVYTSLQEDSKLKLPAISRIMWIITVPAIWSLAARKIMKSAAIMVRYSDTLIFSVTPYIWLRVLKF